MTNLTKVWYDSMTWLRRENKQVIKKDWDRCSCGNYERRVVTNNQGVQVYVCANCSMSEPREGMKLIEEVIKVSGTYQFKEAKTEESETSEDKGQHYRYSYRATLTPEDIEKGFKDINLDPYRICEIYQVGGGYMEHIAKKALRCEEKGHSREDVLKEIICCAERGLQMLQEDK